MSGSRLRDLEMEGGSDVMKRSASRSMWARRRRVASNVAYRSVLSGNSLSFDMKGCAR
jgi:hypothetical protein